MPFPPDVVPAGSSNKLAVDADTGEVTVAVTTDFESEDRNFDVIVHVHDVSANPMTVTVVINVEVTDVDDNVPRFDNDVIDIGTYLALSFRYSFSSGSQIPILQ